MDSENMTTRTIQGRCLCGAVRVTARDVGNNVGACHCKMCRRWAGGPFMEIDCGTHVEFDGDDDIAVFNSSDWAERGFCRACGTHLFYRLKGTGQHMVPVGLFDDDDTLVFDTQVFVDERPAYYEFANRTKNLTSEEIFKMFGGG